MMNEELQMIAKELESLELIPTATLHYDVFSDALTWSDERPRHRRARDLWCMRPIFRYRTGLILGLELEEFKESWNAGKSIFPSWIGFRQERCEPNAILVETYHKLSRK